MGLVADWYGDSRRRIGDSRQMIWGLAAADWGLAADWFRDSRRSSLRGGKLAVAVVEGLTILPIR